MKISRLFIRDFGIINNQIMAGISPGIVVIAGDNRAGKTTIMHLLRHLPYGFPRGNKLPGYQKGYEVEGIINLSETQQINIQLKGYGNPLVKNLTGNELIDLNNYISLDRFTYSQLFTITLDELRKIPEGITDDNELIKLQSLLLGAGLSQFIELPKLEESFNKAAENIGGKFGKPEVARFKPFHDLIRNGVDLKNKANHQLEEYRDKTIKLSNLNNEIEKKGSFLKELSDNIFILDLLKNNYQQYRDMKELKGYLTSDIKEFYQEYPYQYIDKLEKIKEDIYQKEKDYNITRSYLEKIIGEGKDLKILINKLISLEEEIKHQVQQKPVIEERIRNYLDNEKDLAAEKNKINLDIKMINENWSMTDIMDIGTDLLEIDRLNEHLDLYNTLNNKLEKVEEQLEEIMDQEKQLLSRLKYITVHNPDEIFKKYLFISFAILVVGIPVSLYKMVFLLITISGIFGLGLYFIIKNNQDNVIRNNKQNIELELHAMKLKTSDLQEKEYKLQQLLKPVEIRLEEVRGSLNLKQNISFDSLKMFLHETRQIKQNILKWQDNKKNILENNDLLKNKINKIATIIKTIFSEYDLKGVYIREYREYYDKLIEINKILELALELKGVEEELNYLKDNVKNIISEDNKNKYTGDLNNDIEIFLTRGEKYKYYEKISSEIYFNETQLKQIIKSDRARQALDISDDRESLKILLNLYDDYSSYEEINHRYNELIQEENKQKKDYEVMKEERQIIKQELEKLATPDKLEKASELIDDGRKGLQELAERYALYKIASLMLKKTRENFLEKTAANLLSEASTLLSKITGGEFKMILPTDKLTEPDFKLHGSDGKKEYKVDFLSRGTAEQLFLALRISRIKDIKPSLPVIIDDSLVNFDDYHLDRSIDLLIDLAETNQIFIMTCHPYFIEKLSKKDTDLQYWKIKKGEINQSTADKLIKDLSI